ncbi:mutant cadherin [Danaus plexippus plexippus]|uniref:Mutant cadherin n=1 Tax=Danaus plexippus plexippus TaxID=278856 RepID=A0A212ES50_DANPL|nr:mutant cadherin [Danaus plexippus plexippus]
MKVMDEETLIKICKTAFSPEEILAAKKLLFDAVPTKRMKVRKKEEKSKRDLEDILDLLKSTDATDPERIPIFVAKELHRLPPITFDHVDVTRLLRDLNLLREHLNEIRNDCFLKNNSVKFLKHRGNIQVLRQTADRWMTETAVQCQGRGNINLMDTCEVSMTNSTKRQVNGCAVSVAQPSGSDKHTTLQQRTSEADDNYTTTTITDDVACAARGASSMTNVKERERTMADIVRETNTDIVALRRRGFFRMTFQYLAP